VNIPSEPINSIPFCVILLAMSPAFALLMEDSKRVGLLLVDEPRSFEDQQPRSLSCASMSTISRSMELIRLRETP